MTHTELTLIELQTDIFKSNLLTFKKGDKIHVKYPSEFTYTFELGAPRLSITVPHPLKGTYIYVGINDLLFSHAKKEIKCSKAQ